MAAKSNNFLVVGTDHYVNMDNVSAIQVSASNVGLSFINGDAVINITCADNATAKIVAKNIAQAYDPLA